MSGHTKNRGSYPGGSFWDAKGRMLGILSGSGIHQVVPFARVSCLVLCLCLMACGSGSGEYGGDGCAKSEECPDDQTCIMEGLGVQGYCAPDRRACESECTDGEACVFSPPSPFGQAGCRATYLERDLDQYCHIAEVCRSNLCAVSVSEEMTAPTLGVCMAAADDCAMDCGEGWTCASRPAMGDEPHCARVVVPES